jgi:hypothetical protein
MNRKQNIRQPTFNIELSMPVRVSGLFHWTLKVECWLLNVSPVFLS